MGIAMNRWALLSPREKKIVWHIVVLGEKRYTVARNLGVSRTRVCQSMEIMYRVLDVRDVMALGLFVGMNYHEIEMDAVTMGFDMPKERVAYMVEK